MIRFDESTHTYFDGEKALISVTQLMKKHGLSPAYDFAPTDLLEARAKKGTIVHKEIENYVKHGEVGFTDELDHFIKWANDNNVEFLDSEKLVYNDIIAGTCDLLVKRNNKIVRIDLKTTSVVHKTPCSWQISLYDFLDDVKADEFSVLHLSSEHCKEITVDKVPLNEVERLDNCERNGELYMSPTIELSDMQLATIQEVESKYAEAKRIKEEADKLLEEINSQLISVFEKYGVKSFENDFVKITYVPSYTKQTLDTATLKKEHPDIYEGYLKTTTVKPNIKISPKGDKK